MTKREQCNRFCEKIRCDICPLLTPEKPWDHLFDMRGCLDFSMASKEELDRALKLFEDFTRPDTPPVNTCVSCGAEIPEGRLVCPNCEEYTCETCAFDCNSASEEPCVNCKNNMGWRDARYESTPLKWKPVGYTDPDCEVKGNDSEKPIEPDPIKPEYYNDTEITPFDVIDDWGLNFYLGNAVKYIKRAGKKAGNSRLQDLKKIREYIDHEIRAEED